MLVHAVNSVMQVFSASKFGEQSETDTYTAIDVDDILHDELSFPEALTAQNPTAFYDKIEKRFVITWGTEYDESFKPSAGDVAAPLLVCVSKDGNPLLEWTCWALDATLESQPSVAFCSELVKYTYVADYPQCECQPSSVA